MNYIAGERRIVKRLTIFPFRFLYIEQTRRVIKYGSGFDVYYYSFWENNCLTDKASYKTYKQLRRTKR